MASLPRHYPARVPAFRRRVVTPRFCPAHHFTEVCYGNCHGLAGILRRPCRALSGLPARRALPLLFAPLSDGPWEAKGWGCLMGLMGLMGLEGLVGLVGPNGKCLGLLVSQRGPECGGAAAAHCLEWFSK